MQAAVLRQAQVNAGPMRAPVAGRRMTVRVAAYADDVSPNVSEARAWIAKWRAKQGKGSPAPAARSSPPQASSKSSGSSGGKLEPCQSFSDGTIVFSAEKLNSVQYKDIKLKH